MTKTTSSTKMDKTITIGPKMINERSSKIPETKFLSLSGMVLSIPIIVKYENGIIEIFTMKNTRPKDSANGAYKILYVPGFLTFKRCVLTYQDEFYQNKNKKQHATFR